VGRVTKTSDFTGVGLIHTTGPKLDRLAAKYAPLVPILGDLIARPTPRSATRSSSTSSISSPAPPSSVKDQIRKLWPTKSLLRCHDSATRLRGAGDAAGACDQFAVLLPIRERVLGLEHPDTRDNLASRPGRQAIDSPR
jgi:hypothetical protein